MTIVGVDASTKQIALAHITLEGDLSRLETILLEGRHALERVDHARQVVPRMSYWDEVRLVAVELPTPSRTLRGHSEACLILGVLCAHIPAAVDVWLMRPGEWRQALGWPAMRRLDAKRYALDMFGRRVPAPSVDEVEAYWIARAALGELDKAAREAA